MTHNRPTKAPVPVYDAVPRTPEAQIEDEPFYKVNLPPYSGWLVFLIWGAFWVIGVLGIWTLGAFVVWLVTSAGGAV